MRFIVRMSYNTDFTYKIWEKGYSVTKTMVDFLRAYIAEEVCADCMTFCTVIMDMDNAKACEDIVRAAFCRLEGSKPSDLMVMIVEDDGSECADVMKQIYSLYYGWDEYLKLCTRLANTVPLVAGTKAMDAIRSMNYLVSIDEGCGFYTMVNSFGDFANKLNLFTESKGETLHYKLGKEEKLLERKASDVFDDLWLDENENTVVGIDISYYLDKEKADEFRDFLKGLIRIQQKHIFLFRVPVLADSALKDIRDIMNDVLELTVVRIDPYDDFTLMEYALDRLCINQYEMDRDVFDVFLNRVHKEKMDGRFYGYKTADKIVNEIIWEKLRHDAYEKYCGNEYDSDKVVGDDISNLFSEEKVKDAFAELDELIGMEDVKARIEEIVAQLSIAIKNEKVERPCIHMRFEGAPGTGKTTVARIFGRIFKEKGILRKGDFFEYEARSLVGEYVGQTAPKTHAICRDAYGSVLFIDEAYALHSGDGDGKDYGREAITTLIAEMENHRDDMVVIMAGYTDDMKDLMEANAGLRSRMPFVIEFKNYTKEQLAEIFMRMATKSFACEEGFEDKVFDYFNKMSVSYMESREFSNARFVRNLYERTWAKAAQRVAAAGGDEITLTKLDFENASTEKEFSEKLMTDKKIGFRE